MVSVAVLEKIAATRKATSGELSTSLQLSRRHAANVCSELASAGHLRIVSRNGRTNVYAPAQQDAEAPNFSWLFLGPVSK